MLFHRQHSDSAPALSGLAALYESLPNDFPTFILLPIWSNDGAVLSKAQSLSTKPARVYLAVHNNSLNYLEHTDIAKAFDKAALLMRKYASHVNLVVAQSKQLKMCGYLDDSIVSKALDVSKTEENTKSCSWFTLSWRNKATSLPNLITLTVLHTEPDNYVMMAIPSMGETTKVLLLPHFKTNTLENGGIDFQKKLPSMLTPSDTSSFSLGVKYGSIRRCNYKEAQEFYLDNPQDRLPGKFKAEAKKMLVTAKRVLDDLGVPFWLCSGTVLGWYRQCDILAHTTDVDLGIFIEDFISAVPAAFIKAFVQAGFRVSHRFGTVHDSFQLSIKHGPNGKIKLDMFFFYRGIDKSGSRVFWNGGTQARTGMKYRYNFHPFELCSTVFLKQFFRVPCDAVTYIEANYGLRWREKVADKKWDWKKSPPNVRGNGLWPKKDWKHVIQCDACRQKVDIEELIKIQL